MKLRTRGSSDSTMFIPSRKETQVADILVNLTSLASQSAKLDELPNLWGSKKKRSMFKATLSSESPSPPPLKAKAPSPATPLSFSPSESDENPRRNVSLKRKREHYLKTIEELNKDNNLLNGEIENVRKYRDQLEDFNLKLKARKLELSVGPNQEADVVKRQWQLQFPGTVEPVPLMMNQTGVSVGEESGQETTSCSGSGLGKGNNSNSNDMGPIEIPDLNVPLEEETCEAMDVNVELVNKNLSRVMAAQARQNRLRICRVKNPIGSSKTRFFFR